MGVSPRNAMGESMTPMSTPLPKYHRIKEIMLERIHDGTWTQDMLIPSETDLGKEFGVSRITVRRAVSDLVHEGKLRTAQGKGTFVAKPKLQERFVQRAFGIYEDMERRGLQLTTQILRLEVLPAPGDVAKILGLKRDEPVYVLVRLRSVQQEKLLVSTTYMPQALCPNLEREEITAGSLYTLLRTKYRLVIARGERSLEAVAAGPWEARLLDIALSSPLLRLDSVAYLADGRAFEYSQTLHRGDRARVEVEFLPVLDEM